MFDIYMATVLAHLFDRDAVVFVYLSEAVGGCRSFWFLFAHLTCLLMGKQVQTKRPHPLAILQAHVP